MALKPLCIFFFILLLNISSAGNFLLTTNNLQLTTSKADSLKTALTTPKDDTTKIKLLNNLGWELKYQNPDTSILLGKKALELAEHLPTPKGKGLGVRSKLIANSNSNLGFYYTLKGDYPLSLSYHLKALEIRKQLNDQKAIAVSLGNIGIVYDDQGNYPKALKHYFEALVINKELGNKSYMAAALGNIGIVYKVQATAAMSRQNIAMSDSLYVKALKHYFEALVIDKELGNKNGMARHLGNIGIVYMEQAGAAKSPDMNRGSDSLYSKALKHYFEALVIDKELGNKNGMAADLSNIGNVYKVQADVVKSGQDIAGSDSLYAKAMKHYFEALEIAKELKAKNVIAICLGNIGSLYTQTSRFKEAEAYLDSALAICNNIGALNEYMQFEENISHLYDTTARYQLAYTHYKKYRSAKDSLFNEEKSKDIGRLEQNHVFEMAELERIQKELEKSRQEAAAVSRRNILQYSAIFLVLVFLFLGIFLLARRFKKPVIATPSIRGKQSPECHAVIPNDSEGSPEDRAVIPTVRRDRLSKAMLRRFLAIARNDSIIRNDNYINDVKIFEAALFVSFLILFEFILVLIDPYLEKLTGGEPALKLMTNAVLAGVIFLLHNLLEAKLKGRIIKTERGKWLRENRKPEDGGSKTLLLLVGFAFITLFNISFSGKTDSLKNELGNAKDDTTKVNLLNKISWELMYNNPDSSILLSNKALKIATIIN